MCRNMARESQKFRLWTREVTQHVKLQAAHGSTYKQWLCLYSQLSYEERGDRYDEKKVEDQGPASFECVGQ